MKADDDLVFLQSNIGQRQADQGSATEMATFRVREIRQRAVEQDAGLLHGTRTHVTYQT